MTALRPASRRARDEETGEWRTDGDGQFVRERIPGSLPERTTAEPEDADGVALLGCRTGPWRGRESAAVA
ncbi:hypothetical protein ACIGBH_40485 [Streptomyces sp. NPDC085929]|uniref:hypothetical protein n=1 Tax=Streptomyces sp. NPDC085929 TaxID=3365739 RepID=UPI0037D13290